MARTVVISPRRTAHLAAAPTERWGGQLIVTATMCGTAVTYGTGWHYGEDGAAVTCKRCQRFDGEHRAAVATATAFASRDETAPSCSGCGGSGRYSDARGEMRCAVCGGSGRFDERSEAPHAVPAPSGERVPTSWGEGCEYCQRYSRPCGRHEVHPVFVPDSELRAAYGLADALGDSEHAAALLDESHARALLDERERQPLAMCTGCSSPLVLCICGEEFPRHDFDGSGPDAAVCDDCGEPAGHSSHGDSGRVVDVAETMSHLALVDYSSTLVHIAPHGAMSGAHGAFHADSESPHSFGPFADGAQGGARTLCGDYAYGVAEIVDGLGEISCDECLAYAQGAVPHAHVTTGLDESTGEDAMVFHARPVSLRALAIVDGWHGDKRAARVGTLSLEEIAERREITRRTIIGERIPSHRWHGFPDSTDSDTCTRCDESESAPQHISVSAVAVAEQGEATCTDREHVASDGWPICKGDECDGRTVACTRGLVSCHRHESRRERPSASDASASSDVASKRAERLSVRITRRGDASERARRVAMALGVTSDDLARAAQALISPSAQEEIARRYSIMSVPVPASRFSAGSPVDAAAARAWTAFAVETMRQYAHVAREIDVEIVDVDPYGDAAEMRRDVESGHIFVLATASTGGHPILSDSVNDAFRAVHDVIGHAATGRGFDRHGEEAAYLVHARCYSPLARGALATETRGQNAAMIARGSFDAQRIGLLPARFRDVHALAPSPRELPAAREQARAMHV